MNATEEIKRIKRLLYFTVKVSGVWGVELKVETEQLSYDTVISRSHKLQLCSRLSENISKKSRCNGFLFFFPREDFPSIINPH